MHWQKKILSCHIQPGRLHVTFSMTSLEIFLSCFLISLGTSLLQDLSRNCVLSDEQTCRYFLLITLGLTQVIYQITVLFKSLVIITELWCDEVKLVFSWIYWNIRHIIVCIPRNKSRLIYDIRNLNLLNLEQRSRIDKFVEFRTKILVQRIAKYCPLQTDAQFTI